MDRTIGKFEIIRPLGHGAMGEVFLARDPSIGREVAVKTILPSLVPMDDVRLRFAREAQAAGLLQHPNVATVFEYGEDSDVLYLAMEYVPGEDLGALLQGEELSGPQILEIVAQVCEGLHHAHKQGIVHRDIKPSNIMVLRDEEGAHAKIMDFGVAKTAHSDLTQSGQIMGTLAYMAPEYLRTGKASPQSDQFSVGVLLYEALAGVKPFPGETTGAVVYSIIHDLPRPLDPECLQGVSPAVRTLVERALSKEPGERFAATGDLAKALRSAKNPLWSTTGDATVVLDKPKPGTTERVKMDVPHAPRWPWALGLAAVAIGA
ncbi:MAG: serine/threonine protein kinase, partial [Acidobacteriota bacterium]|nr:serine/threonine protein kinase [Acidobacteriota bacterium]